jgi:signal recognition particle receptor subunit beta
VAISQSASPVADALARLSNLARQESETAAARQLTDLADRARRHEFRLAVAGQFKRGKSTVINALVGQALLPTDVLPLTSVPTFLAGGAKFAITVTFLDGSSQPIGPSELAQFATEAGNPSNRRGVERVSIVVPDPLPVPDLCLMDLPGVGSTVEANSTVAYDTLADADAALFIIGADPPITEQEGRFLRHLAQDVARVFVIQNKQDLFDPDDWARAVAFNHRVVSEVLGPTAIYSVSARRALDAKLRRRPSELSESGWSALESDLIRFFQTERRSVWRASLELKVEAAVNPVFQGLSVRQAALGTPLNELRDRLGRLEERQAELRQAREDVAVLFRRDLDRERTQMDDRLREWVRLGRSLVMEELSHATEPTSRDAWDAWMVEAVRRRASEALADEQERWRLWWRSQVEALAATANRLLAGIQDAYQELLGVQWTSLGSISLPAVEMTVRVTDLDRQSFFPEVSWSLFTPLMPPTLRRKILMQRTKERLPELLDRFRGRIRQTIATAADTSSQEMLSQLNHTLEDLDARLRSAAERTLRERTEAEDALPRLKAALAEELAIWLDAVGEVKEALRDEPRTP